MKDGIEQADISEINGIRIGNATDLKAATGCTVIICDDGATAGVDVRGGSPGTRETDALDPANLRQKIHAVLLAGGSAFGLDAAGGVMRYIEELGVGRDVGVAKVPIVCGAILYDLECGDCKVRPDAKMGYEACLDSESGVFEQGSVGAGTGATVGKTKGYDFAMKGGLGSACLRVGELIVGAVMAVNCVGDVYDASSGRFIAGMLTDDKMVVDSSESEIAANYRIEKDFFSGNTIIGVVVTNANLNKSQANKLASVSHDGIARAVRPSHSIYDGDTIFTMAVGGISANQDAVGLLAARAVEQAIVNAVRNAESLCGFPAYGDFQQD